MSVDGSLCVLEADEGEWETVHSLAAQALELAEGRGSVAPRLSLLQLFGQASFHLDGPEAALPVFEEVVASSRELAPVFSCAAQMNLGRTYWVVGRREEGERALREAVRSAETVLASHPEKYEAAVMLSAALNSLGAICGETDRVAEAGEHLARSLQILEELVARNPERPTSTPCWGRTGRTSD